MKTITYSNYLDQWPTLVNDFNQELKQSSKFPMKFNHRINGPGTITMVRAKVIGSELEIVATYEKKKFADIKDYRTFFSLGLVTLAPEDEQFLTEAQDMFKTACRDRVSIISDKCQKEAAEQRQRKAELQAHQAELKKQKAIEKRIKKAEETYEERKNKAIAEFQALESKIYIPSKADELYFSLGWLAKHIGTLSAAMPDYLESHFTRHFGAEVPHRVVDSKKVGASGYTSQWSWSFQATLKKHSTVPALVQTYLNTSGKAVTDRTFIWDLVDNHGFQFGSKQDLDRIRQLVPSTYQGQFEAGLKSA